jgi:demethylmenaquinone methyltransferase/2-methoxy-6-polyprenyl-1,4-benzoquinol methylase
MSLREDIATPDKKRRYVRTLFATIADRYDFITVALSYGLDRRWKQRVVALAGRTQGRVLDLATGTGDIAYGFGDDAARVVGLDITPRMIELARAKHPARSQVHFLVGDMLALPFPSRSFDAVTVGYGLRNVPDLGVALDEIARVVRPGGCLVSLDFNRPSNPFIRWLYFVYLNAVGGALGWALHNDPDTYRYIPASLRTYPGAEGVASMLRARGFSRVDHMRVLFGLLAIHHARRD